LSFSKPIATPQYKALKKPFRANRNGFFSAFY
jgi:hypothetical protein